MLHERKVKIRGLALMFFFPICNGRMMFGSPTLSRSPLSKKRRHSTNDISTNLPVSHAAAQSWSRPLEELISQKEQS